MLQLIDQKRIVFFFFLLSDKYLWTVDKRYLVAIITSTQSSKSNLLRRLQAQTLPDTTSPVGKIDPFRKITVTVEPIKRF